MSRTRTTAVAAALAALTLPALTVGCGASGDVVATDPSSEASSSSPGDEEPTPEPSPTPETDDGSYPDFAPTDYDYRLKIFCFCPGSGVPVDVQVRDDEVVSATWARGGRGVKAGEPVGALGEISIDDVIATARDAEAGNAARVDVEWPEGQAYPTSISVDRSELIADEEIGYAVSRVVVDPVD